MPEKQKDWDKALDGLDDQIVSMVGTFVKKRRDHYEQAAIKFKDALRKDAKRYTKMLADKKISEEDFEFLMRGRAAQVKVELLSEVSISKSKFSVISEELIGLILKTMLLLI